MPPSTIREAPAMDSFTPLAEYQSQTPESFHGAKPVLYYHISMARVLGKKADRDLLPVLQPVPAEVADNVPEICEHVDIYVSSESFILYNSSYSIGVSIPYPAISLHAIKRMNDPTSTSHVNSADLEIQTLYMQLFLASPSESEEEPPETEITLCPPLDGGCVPSEESKQAFIKGLFEGVSACADLHPDPQDEDSDQEMSDSRIMFEGNVGYEGISGLPGAFSGVSDGGLPPPFPGSGGWITAENVGEYFDQDGNYIRGEGEEELLGEGAGRVRGREEVEDEEPQVNGHGEDGEEIKRARVE